MSWQTVFEYRLRQHAAAEEGQLELGHVIVEQRDTIIPKLVASTSLHSSRNNTKHGGFNLQLWFEPLVAWCDSYMVSPRSCSTL